MKIRGWSIDGFGVFRNYEVQDLPEGLVVFHGPNEVGKSTLLAFLRAAMFGSRHPRHRAPVHPPLFGGRHGGRLLCSGPDGVYTIDRGLGRRPALRVTRPDGEEGTQADLDRLLGGADSRLFRSVFAFSLHELQSLDHLDAPGIREHVFSAALAGAGRSARTIRARLQATGDKLLDRGRGHIIDLTTALTEVRGRLEAARASAERYGQRLIDETRAREELRRLDQSVADLQARKASYDTLVDLWPIWRELDQARGELAGLPVIDHFPSDPEQRLAGALAAATASKTLADDLEAERASALARRKDLVPDDRLTDLAAEVEYLSGSLPAHRDRLVALARSGNELRRAETGLDQRLGALGAGWNRGRLTTFDLSVAKSDEVREWADRLATATQDAERAQATMEQVATSHRELKRVRDKMASSLTAPEPRLLATLEEEEQLLRRSRTALGDLRVAEAEVKLQEAVVSDRERPMDTLNSEILLVRLHSQKGLKSLPAWITIGAWTSTAAGLLLAFWRLAVGDQLGSAALACLAIVAALVAEGTRYLRKQLAESDERRESHLTALRRDMRHAVRELTRRQKIADDLRDQISTDAVRLGLPGLPSQQDIEERHAAVVSQRNRRREWDQARANLAEADSELARIGQELREARAALDEAEGQVQQLEEEWTAWKSAAGVPATLTPASALDFFAALRTAREAAQACENMRGRIAQLEQATTEWEARARETLGRLAQLKPLDSTQLIKAVLALRARCVQDTEVRQLRAQLDTTIGTLTSKLEVARQRVAAGDAERMQLLAEAGAADDDDFRARLDVVRRRRRLDELIRDRETLLDARLGRGAEAEQILATLATGQLDDWRRLAGELASEIAAAEEARDAARLRHRRDDTQTSQGLAESGLIPTLQLQAEVLKTELSDAIANWQVTALAESLVDGALRKFEETRQPKVLSRASEAFAAVTAARYTRLVQSNGHGDIAVIDAKGKRKRVDQLSRGTAEELYLCLRLGLASEFAGRGTEVPLIMDDVLVNFDPQRARAMGQLLIDLAHQHQVMLFTCHPETRDLLRKLEPSIAVIEMDAASTAGGVDDADSDASSADTDHTRPTAGI